MVHVQKISGLRKLEDDSIWKSLYVITKKNKPPHPETTAQFIQKKKKTKQEQQPCKYLQCLITEPDINR